MRAKPWSSRAAGHQLVVSPSLQPPSNHSKTNKYSDEPMTDRNGRREEANGRRRVAVWPYRLPSAMVASCGAERVQSRAYARLSHRRRCCGEWGWEGLRDWMIGSVGG